METRASFITVGVFVLLFMAGIVAAIVWLARIDVSGTTASYDILFDGAVTGLQVGNPVRYRGVPVGVVTGMAINPDNVEQVRVTIEVPTDTPIKQDTEASLEFQGITGVAFVQLSGGTNAAPRLEPRSGDARAVIASRPSSLQEVIEQAPELINRFIAVVDRANAILSPANQANVEAILGNLAELSSGLAEGTDDMRRILNEGADAIAELRGAVRESEVLIRSFSQRSDALARLAEEALSDGRALIGEARPLVAEGTRALATVTTTLERSQGTLDRLETSLDAADGALAAGERTLTGAGELIDVLTPEVVPMAATARSTLEEFALVAADLRSAANNIADASEEIAGLLADNRDPVAEFTGTGLAEFTQLVAESRVLVSALTRISTELERDPARFLFGDRQQGLEVD